MIGLHMGSVAEDRRVAAGAHALLAHFLVVRDPRRRRGLSVDDTPEELDAKRVAAVALAGGLDLGPERRVAGRGLELAGECLVVEHDAQAVAGGIGMRNQVDLEEIDPCAKRPRPRRRRAANPVADVVDGIVAFGRVDEHRLHALGDERVGERVDARDERPCVAGHERGICGAIRERPEPRGGTRAHLREQRQRLVQPRFIRRAGAVGQHDDGRADHLHQVMRAELVTGMSENQNPRSVRTQKRRDVVRHQFGNGGPMSMSLPHGARSGRAEAWATTGFKPAE